MVEGKAEDSVVIEPILAGATLLGGIAAVWYFWDKIKPRIRSTSTTERTVIPRLARLRIELPERINPPGYISGAAFVPGWNVRVRLIADGDVQPLDIVEVGLTEDGVGPWTIDELFLQARGERLDLPIRLNPSAEFWLRARSPMAFAAKPIPVGRLTLWFRDHTQKPGERHEYQREYPPIA